MKEKTRNPGPPVSGNRLDLPKIKKRADFAGKNYSRLGSSWAEFYGRDVFQLVEELEEAQGKLEVLEGFREQLNVFSGHSSILVDKLKVTIDAILRGTKEGK